MFVLKRREKVIAVLAGIALFLLFWLYVVLPPIRNFEQDLDADLKFKNMKLYEAKKILGETGQGSSANDALKQFLSDGSTQEEMSRLIKEIETAATGAGLKVSETKPQPLLKNVGWYELKVNISFEGRWSDVVRFLYMLDNGPKLLLIDEMSLEANLPQQMTIRGRLEIGRLLVMKTSDL